MNNLQNILDAVKRDATFCGSDFRFKVKDQKSFTADLYQDEDKYTSYQCNDTQTFLDQFEAAYGGMPDPAESADDSIADSFWSVMNDHYVIR